ncbi:ZIP family metal transporter [Aureibacillus halotolerans]|uniref:ZIP family zinc transporter n=1 Tax=Aureibacillus halotolerans TaxID=1508390 RepID=A0A4V3D661_9BACI|nr:ZIP family metal transporter [Aureibacillus halotolerans]TDQ42737.1 ZIP family zinc transporter [Aureibacillus halotolerans]
MLDVLIGSVLSAMATGLGALPILMLQNVTHRWRDIMLAFTAGVMMAAATFSLIPQALEEGSYVALVIGIFLGALVLTSLEYTIPHVELDHRKQTVPFDRKALLVIAAITLHNIPEGLSVGVSYASDDEGLGGLVALAIGLQNAPEGFLVALYLIQEKVKKHKAFLIATATGAVEIVSSLLGYFLTAVVAWLVPIGLAFAAGAMLFIIYKELIPESHGDGHERPATFAFIVGLLLMILLTTIF